MTEQPPKQDGPSKQARDLSGRILLTNRPEDIGATRDKLLKAIETSGFPEAAAFAIRLAFDEAVANAFKHGHAELPPDVPVVVSLAVDASAVQDHHRGSGPRLRPWRRCRTRRWMRI